MIDFLTDYEEVKRKNFESGGLYAVLEKGELTYVVIRFVRPEDYLDSKELHTNVMSSIGRHGTKFAMIVDVRGFEIDAKWTTHILDLCEFHRGLKKIYVEHLVCSNILMECSASVTNLFNTWLKIYQPLRPLHVLESDDPASEIQKNIKDSSTK